MYVLRGVRAKRERLFGAIKFEYYIYICKIAKKKTFRFSRPTFLYAIIINKNVRRARDLCAKTYPRGYACRPFIARVVAIVGHGTVGPVSALRNCRPPHRTKHFVHNLHDRESSPPPGW